MMKFLQYLAGSLWLLNLTASVIGTWLVLRHFSRKRSTPSEKESWPGVSILKPLKGADADLSTNLSSFFQIEYPEFEIIFSVARADDQAVEIVEALMQQFPEVKARLIVGAIQIGPNPKVNNLLRPYARAANDLVMVSDSNVRISPNYLKHLVSEMKDDVGVVTGIVAARGAKDWAGAIESVYLNSFFSRWMRLGSKAGVPFVMGKAMLFKKSVAEKFGGLKGLSEFIAEDYWMGRKMKAAGFRIACVRQPIHQHLGSYSMTSFWSRHVRWGRIRKYQAPFAFLLEPMGTALASATAGAWFLSQVLGLPLWACFIFNVTVSIALDMALIHRLSEKLHPKMLLAWWMRELLAIPLWAHTISGNSVSWRGTKLVLKFGGTVDYPENVSVEHENAVPLLDSVIQVI